MNTILSSEGFYIGDLCYLVNDQQYETWIELNDSSNNEYNPSNLLCNNLLKALVEITAYGDSYFLINLVMNIQLMQVTLPLFQLNIAKKILLDLISFQENKLNWIGTMDY